MTIKIDFNAAATEAHIDTLAWNLDWTLVRVDKASRKQPRSDFWFDSLHETQIHCLLRNKVHLTLTGPEAQFTLEDIELNLNILIANVIITDGR